MCTISNVYKNNETVKANDTCTHTTQQSTCTGRRTIMKLNATNTLSLENAGENNNNNNNNNNQDNSVVNTTHVCTDHHNNISNNENSSAERANSATTRWFNL